MTVDAIIRKRPADVISVSEGEGFAAISERLARHNIGVVVVLSEEGGLRGIISERDLVRAYAARKGEVSGVTAREIMTRKVFICAPADTEIQVMTYMLQNRIRHMPVVADGKVLGVVSLADAVRHRLVKINLLFEELENEPDEEKRRGLFTRHLKGRLKPRVQ